MNYWLLTFILVPRFQVIRAAKLKGMRVTCEVCPHHLFLTEEDKISIGANKVG